MTVNSSIINDRFVVKTLRAIAHPMRFKALQQIHKYGEIQVAELQNILHTEQSLLSHHLSKMRKAGVLRTKRHGRIIRYSIADPALMDLLRAMNDLNFKDTQRS
jgi:ArsR family transcriptional regulator